MDIYKEILGSLAVLIGLSGYGLYFKDIFRGIVKPHAFSWFVWGVLGAIGFAAQRVGNGGPGTWVAALSCIMCLTVSVIGFSRGTRDITRFDWFSLMAAGLGLLLWWRTNEPLYAILIVSIVNAIGFLPTFRKGYYKPFEDSVGTFMISSFKYIIALGAFTTYSLTVVLYPASLILTNSLFVLLLLVRRRIVLKRATE